MTIHPAAPRLWALRAAAALLAGLYWIACSEGLAGVLFAWPVGVLLIAGAAVTGLLPGESRGPAMGALGAVLAVPIGVLWMLFGDFGAGFLATALAVLGGLLLTREALLLQPRIEGVPPLRHSLRLDAKALFDEAMMGYFILGARLPDGHRAAEMSRQVASLAESLEARGALEAPGRIHMPPPAPETTRLSAGRIYGFDYQSIRFDSAFQADEQLPGGDVWNRLEANREVNLRVLRQTGADRPWLIGVHGYRMGEPWMDFSLFSPRWLHERLGLNLVLPVLPLHGSRRIGLRSGDFYLDGDPLDLYHAQCQALSDLRQTVAWIRQQAPEAPIGVYGISLGGYNAALLSAYEDLDFAVSTIPVADFAPLLWSVLPEKHHAFYEAHGLGLETYERVLRPVSPLAVPTRLAPDRRFVIGALGDRIVPTEHPLRLAQHWGVEPVWYNGSHLSIRRERVVRDTIEQAMVMAGWSIPPR